MDQIRKMFPPDEQEMVSRLAEVAENVELHVDARSDFAMTAQVRGADEAKVTDLGKSLGGALALARMQAQAEGKDDLAQFLEFAKVRPEGNTFNLELAVPLDVIRKHLSFCREQQDQGMWVPPQQQEARPTP